MTRFLIILFLITQRSTKPPSLSVNTSPTPPSTMPSSMPSAMPLPRGSVDASFTATLLPHKIQYATRKAINAKPRCALMRLRENSAKNTLNRLQSSTLLKPRASGSGLQSKAQRGRCTPTFRDALLAEKEVAGSRISSGCAFQAFQ